MSYPKPELGTFLRDDDAEVVALVVKPGTTLGMATLTWADYDGCDLDEVPELEIETWHGWSAAMRYERGVDGEAWWSPEGDLVTSICVAAAIQ